MTNSAVYAANTTTQSVSVGGTINFGSVVHRKGCSCNVAGGNLTISGAGYYNVDADFTVEGTTVGTVIIQLYKNGTAISGASAEITVADGDMYNVSISTLIRLKCCCENVITAVVTAVGADITSASVRAAAA